MTDFHADLLGAFPPGWAWRTIALVSEGGEDERRAPEGADDPFYGLFSFDESGTEPEEAHDLLQEAQKRAAALRPVRHARGRTRRDPALAIALAAVVLGAALIVLGFVQVRLLP